MKICHIITRMDWSGAPDIVAMVCRHQIAQGHDVWLVTGPNVNLSAKTLTFLKEFSGKVRIISSLNRAVNLACDMSSFLRVWALLRGQRFDVVCCHTSKAGFIGRFAARAAGVKKIVYMPHGHIFYGYFNRLLSNIFVFLERMAARVTDTILVLTDLEKHDFILYNVAPASKLKVVPSGLDMNEFTVVTDKKSLCQKLQLPHDKILIGLVCRLEPVKGADVFIDAALMLARKRDDVFFVVAGQGSMGESLWIKVKNQRMSGNFKFLGWRDDARDVIGCLNVLVQPSRNEAVGRVLLEAQALNVPVIATRVGGVPVIVKDQETGILVESEDVAGLAGAMNRMVEDPQSCQRMSANAARAVRENYTVEHMLAKIDEAFV